MREPGGYRHSDADIGRELRDCLADDVGLWAGRQVRLAPFPGVVLVRNGLQPKEPLPAPQPEQPDGAATKMGKPGYER